jgi:RNA polymerase sigma-70 factor (ECF subfamily)
MTRDPVEEGRLLAAVRGGDESAFAALVEPYRRELHAHCYRMLASLQEAEDALQETLLRAWRGLPRFEGRSSLRTWLHTIATNTCLRAVERRPPRTIPFDVCAEATVGEAPGRPLVESVWLQPFPDRYLVDDGGDPAARAELRESVELAFVAALQHLPPLQRAALVLREVLDFSAAETATALATSVPAVNSALQRARRTVDEKLPGPTQRAARAGLGEEKVEELVRRYMAAMEAGAVDDVVELLVEDATWTMPPLSTWYRGLEAIRVFLRDHPLTQRWRHAVTWVNGQPASVSYMRDDDGVFRVHAVDVLSVRDGRISSVDAFLDPAVFPHLDVPLELR